MKYPRSILKGYSGPNLKRIAEALNMPLKGGGKMKIPMSVLKGDKKAKKSGGKMKMSMLKKMDKEDKGEKNFKKKGEDE